MTGGVHLIIFPFINFFPVLRERFERNILHEQMENDVCFFVCVIRCVVAAVFGQIANINFEWCLRKCFRLRESLETNQGEVRNYDNDDSLQLCYKCEFAQTNCLSLPKTAKNLPKCPQ